MSSFATQTGNSKWDPDQLRHLSGYGPRRAPAHNWRRAEELDRRPGSGFGGGGAVVAGGALYSKGAMGAAVGAVGSNPADCSPHRSRAWPDWTGVGRNFSLDGLGTPALCTDSLPRGGHPGRTRSAALHYAADRKGTHLGVHPYPNRAGDISAILGCAVVGTPVGRGLRLQSPS